MPTEIRRRYFIPADAEGGDSSDFIGGPNFIALTLPIVIIIALLVIGLGVIVRRRFSPNRAREKNESPAINATQRES